MSFCALDVGASDAVFKNVSSFLHLCLQVTTSYKLFVDAFDNKHKLVNNNSRASY